MEKNQIEFLECKIENYEQAVRALELYIEMVTERNLKEKLNKILRKL